MTDVQPVHTISDPGADPWAFSHAGKFYLLLSEHMRVITLRSADSLTELASAKPEVVWEAEPNGSLSQNIWAPELHFLDGRWYLYFAASSDQAGSHRMHVLESASDDPAGPYTYRGKLHDPAEDIWAIDGTVLEHDGQRYFVWSGWPSADAGFPQNLYISPMANPWTLSGPRRLIAEPDQPWEQSHKPILEGPQVLRRDQQLFIVYSADASWTEDYKLGLLRFRGGDMLNRACWEKHARPVFEKHGSAYGPGHASFILINDNQDWIVYHAKKDTGHNWDRAAHAQPFTWTADGLPEFGKPLATAPTLIES